MGSPLRISIFSSVYIQAAVLAIRAANNEVEAEIRAYTKSELQPVFQEQMSANAGTKMESYVLADTARVAVSNQTVTLSSATVNGHFSGGLDVKSQYGPFEFGADQSTTSTFTQRSRRGKPYTRTSHTHRQFLPVNSHGYLFYPTVAALIPRFASLWVQTAMRTIGDAIDSAGSKQS